MIVRRHALPIILPIRIHLEERISIFNFVVQRSLAHLRSAASLNLMRVSGECACPMPLLAALILAHVSAEALRPRSLSLGRPFCAFPILIRLSTECGPFIPVLVA